MVITMHNNNNRLNLFQSSGQPVITVCINIVGARSRYSQGAFCPVLFAGCRWYCSADVMHKDLKSSKQSNAGRSVSLYVSPFNKQDEIGYWFSRDDIVRCMTSLFSKKVNLTRLTLNIYVVHNKFFFTKRKEYTDEDLLLAKTAIDTLNVLLRSLYTIQSFSLKEKFNLDNISNVIHNVTKALQRSIKYNDNIMDPKNYADVCTYYVSSLKDKGELPLNFTFIAKKKDISLPKIKGYKPKQDAIIENINKEQWAELCKEANMSHYGEKDPIVKREKISGEDEVAKDNENTNHAK